MKYKLLTPATLYAVSLAEAKAHLRVDHTDDDTYITQLIKVATDAVEQYTGRQLLPATWAAYADSFEPVLRLRPSPVSGVTSLKYFNSANTEITLTDNTDYFVDLVSAPAEIVPVSSWPATYARPNAVVVEFTAGYASADLVPDAIKQAMLLLIYHYYDHREEVITRISMTEMPKTSTWLLDPYRIKTF